jgi:hypothetical protein
MAYLNAQQREELLNELKNMRFNRAKGKVRGMDDKSRLVFYRNAQRTGRLMTRYDLPTLGTRVTLVEGMDEKDNGGKLKAEYALSEVWVEPLPGNKT